MLSVGKWPALCMAFNGESAMEQFHRKPYIMARRELIRTSPPVPQVTQLPSSHHNGSSANQDRPLDDQETPTIHQDTTDEDRI